MFKISKSDRTLILLLIPISLIFINYIASSLTILFYKYDVEYSEGFILSQSIKLLNGGNIYGNIFSAPYSITYYPPLFFILNSFTITMFGENLFSARIISFLSSIFIGILIYFIVYKKTERKIFGIISSLLFFSSFITFYIGPLARTEVLATLFSLIGIYFIREYKSRTNLCLAITFFTLSVFTKQTFIAAPLASFLYLFIKDRKIGFEFLAILSLSILLIFSLINLMTNGQFFLHIFKYGMGIFKFDQSLFIFLIEKNFIVLAIGFFYFLKNRKDLFSIYFIVSFIILVIQTMRIGGSIYYFFELTAITSILSVLLLKKLSKYDRLFLVIIIIFQLAVFVQSDFRSLFFIFQPNDYPPLVNLATDEKISNYVKNYNALVEHATYNIINGKEIPLQVSSVYELEQNSILNKYEVLDFIKSQDYSLIIYYSRLPLINGLGDYIEKNYILVERLEWKSLENVDWNWLVYKRI